MAKSPRSAVRAAWDRHQDLLGGAGSLVTTTGLASALGFAYWTLSARLFSQEAVGYGSAAVSAMTLLGTVGMLGLGTVLIGELPRRTSRAGLISAALLASFGGRWLPPGPSTSCSSGTPALVRTRASRSGMPT